MLAQKTSLKIIQFETPVCKMVKSRLTYSFQLHIESGTVHFAHCCISIYNYRWAACQNFPKLRIFGPWGSGIHKILTIEISFVHSMVKVADLFQRQQRYKTCNNSSFLREKQNKCVLAITRAIKNLLDTFNCLSTSEHFHESRRKKPKTGWHGSF